jgi:Ca2+-binding RTX toxin-like protein
VELVAGDGSGSGGADAADGGEGTDRVSYASSLVGVTIDVPAGIAHGDVDDTLTGFEAYRGSYHGDTMLGSDGPDVFDALEAWGDDVDQLDGRGGDDTLTADEGTILGGAGDDTYRASARPTRDLGIWLGAGDDRAEIQQGRTTVVRGGAGDDVFAVIQPDYGKVQPRLHGGPGTDLLSFARFDHPVSVDLAARTASAKKLRAGVYGVEQVDGTFGADRLWGRAGPDVLRGLAGADTLSGRRGPDTLLGGKAHDRANGGPGRDTCAAESQTACEKPA